jgi:hypothetical protein
VNSLTETWHAVFKISIQEIQSYVMQGSAQSLPNLTWLTRFEAAGKYHAESSIVRSGFFFETILKEHRSREVRCGGILNWEHHRDFIRVLIRLP